MHNVEWTQFDHQVRGQCCQEIVQNSDEHMMTVRRNQCSNYNPCRSDQSHFQMNCLEDSFADL